MIRSIVARFRRLYGAGPLHVLGAVICFAVVGAAVAGWFEEATVSLKYILIWFVGAILLHDLVFLPFYSALDRLATARRPAAEQAPSRPPGWVYVRVPCILCGLVLLVYAPEILRLGNDTYRIASGQNQDVYMARYLAIVAIVFALSALAYLFAALRHRGAQRAPDS